jgi:hypothetical protein
MYINLLRLLHGRAFGQDTFAILIGPSGECALPLAGGINEGYHYLRYYSSYLVVVVTIVIKTPEWDILHGLLTN